MPSPDLFTTILQNEVVWTNFRPYRIIDLTEFRLANVVRRGERSPLLSASSCASGEAHRAGSLMTDDLIGKKIGGYEILELIGRGGMASVYRAHQVSMNRTVAIKMLRNQYLNDDNYMQRFHREVKIVAQLEHRNIVPVHDYGEENEQPYIVMRYMAGGSIDDLLENGAMDLDQIVKLLDQIAPALDYAH